MAEATVTNRTDEYWGQKRVVMADLASIDNADTWTTGLQSIEFWAVMPTAAAATTQLGGTVSGGTITFAVESGSLAGKGLAVGS